MDNFTPSGFIKNGTLLSYKDATPSGLFMLRIVSRDQSRFKKGADQFRWPLNSCLHFWPLRRLYTTNSHEAVR